MSACNTAEAGRGLQKTIRVRDPELLRRIKQMPCSVCGRAPGDQLNPIDPSHIKTRGAGGPDLPFNVWAKCRSCHIDWGYSWVRFLTRNPQFREKLEICGWEIDLENATLRHPYLEGTP